jgi:hypothetical protein
MLQTFKVLTAIIFLVGLLGLSSKPVYAAIDCSFTPSRTPGGDAPSPAEIVCPFARVINIFLLSSGAFLIIMLLFGGVKLAMAHGDPKGMQAASGTWTWALIGFFIVVGAITLLTLVGKLIGWEYQDPLATLQNAIREFMALIDVQ